MSIVKIQHIKIESGGQASIVFNVIPQSYTDLYLTLSLRSNRSDYADYFDYLKFNGSTTGYSNRNLSTFATDTPYSATDRVSVITGNTATSNAFSSAKVYIPDYTSSNQKSYSIDAMTENNSTLYAARIAAGLWTGTDPITSIEIDPAFGSLLMENSTATLYGITAGSDGVTTVS